MHLRLCCINNSISVFIYVRKNCPLIAKQIGSLYYYGGKTSCMDTNTAVVEPGCLEGVVYGVIFIPSEGVCLLNKVLKLFVSPNCHFEKKSTSPEWVAKSDTLFVNLENSHY